MMTLKSALGTTLLFVALALATSGCVYTPTPTAYPQGYAPTTYYAGEPSPAPTGAVGFGDGNHVTVFAPPPMGQADATATTQAEGVAAGATADAPFVDTAAPALAAPAAEAPALEGAGATVEDGVLEEEAGDLVWLILF